MITTLNSGFDLNYINQMIVVIETRCVFFEVRTEYVYNSQLLVVIIHPWRTVQ
jgi:hypothetical protein